MRMRSAVRSTTFEFVLGPEDGRDDVDVAGPGQVERLADVVRAALGGADEADPRAARQAGDLVDEFDVAGADDHRHDRDPAGDEGLGLLAVERRRRHEVVVEAIEALGQVVEQRALGLDEPGELVDQPLGIEAGVGVRAFGVEDPDEGPGTLALRRGRERGRGDLVGREPGVGRAPEHLGHDARRGLRRRAAAAAGRRHGCRRRAGS